MRTDQTGAGEPIALLPEQAAAFDHEAMDVVGAACCGVGAMVVMSGRGSTPVSALALGLGFYGIHRALRTGPTKVLIATPAVVWLLGHLWSFVPERLVDASST